MSSSVIFYHQARAQDDKQELQWQTWGTLPLTRGGASMGIDVDISPTYIVTVDPEVRGGVPCAGAARIPIAHILRRMALGATLGQVLADYPGLTLRDVQAALKAAAWVMGDTTLDWQAMKVPEMLDYQDEMWAWESASAEALQKYDRAEA